MKLPGRWSAALAMALLGLTPFVILSTAGLLQATAQRDDLHAGRASLQLVHGSPVIAAALVGVGLAAVVTLVVREYRSTRPLIPAEVLAHTLPVVGIEPPW